MDIQKDNQNCDIQLEEAKSTTNANTSYWSSKLKKVKDKLKLWIIVIKRVLFELVSYTTIATQTDQGITQIEMRQLSELQGLSIETIQVLITLFTKDVEQSIKMKEMQESHLKVVENCQLVILELQQAKQVQIDQLKVIKQ